MAKTFDEFVKSLESTKVQRELSEDELQQVSGGVKDYGDYFTAVYTCPQCKRQHTFKYGFNVYISWDPFWYDGCIDVTVGYDIETLDGGRRGNIVSRRDGHAIPFTVISATSHDGQTIVIG